MLLGIFIIFCSLSKNGYIIAKVQLPIWEAVFWFGLCVIALFRDQSRQNIN